MANPLTDAQFVRLLDDRLEKVFRNEFGTLPSIIEKFYDKVKNKKASLEYYSVGSVPDPVAFNGIVEYQGVAPGYHVKITPKEFAGGITIQRRLLDTDRYDVIEELAGGLGEAAKRKMNKIAHEPFIYFDSSALNYMEWEAAEALCANSHATKATGVSTSTGFDNLSTLAFDATNLEAVRLQTIGFKSDIGERYTTNFDTIVHPSNLAEKVWEVMNSQGKWDENTNTANFQRGRWKAIELPLLDDYDTNAWFLIDSKQVKKMLKWHEGIPLEFHNTTDFDTFMRKYISYFVVGWGFRDWRWICGANPS